MGFLPWFKEPLDFQSLTHFFLNLQENINIEEASRFLVKHIIASESDPIQSIEPDIIKPHLNAPKVVSCSACFKT